MVIGVALTLVATFLVVAFGFCLTLHIAARYVLGDVPIRNAIAGAVPAGIVFALTLAGQPIPAGIIAIAADVIVIESVYGIAYRWAGLVTLIHFTVSIIIAFALRNLLLLLETAPT